MWFWQFQNFTVQKPCCKHGFAAFCLDGMCSGTFCSVFYIICLLWMGIDDIPVFTTSLGLVLDTLLYGIFGVMVLTPIKCRLKKI